MTGALSVILGLLVAVAALWTVHPLLTLLPAVLLVLFGLIVPDDVEDDR